MANTKTLIESLLTQAIESPLLETRWAVSRKVTQPELYQLQNKFTLQFRNMRKAYANLGQEIPEYRIRIAEVSGVMILKLIAPLVVEAVEDNNVGRLRRTVGTAEEGQED